jgi:protein TonB
MKMTEVTTLSKLKSAEAKTEQIKPLDTPPPPPLKSSIKFTPPVIKKDNEVADEDEIKSQEEVMNSKVAVSVADIKGTDEKNGKDIAEFKEVTQAGPAEEKPYTTVEQMPAFPGGDAALLQYLSKNLKYPAVAQENGIQGKVIVRFVVSKTGDVGNVEVLKGIDPSCDKEAIRVVKMLPKFIPGKQNGNNVPVYYMLPVTFSLRN